MKTYDIVQSI